MMVRISEKEFKIKYELYAQMLLNISYGYTKNKFDSEDIIQNVFIKYLKSKKEFNTLEDEKYWLIRVTINECKNFVKSSYQKNVILNDDVVTNLSVKSEEDEVELLFDYIKQLPEKYKKVIILHYFNSLTIKEISDILGSSISSIKKQLERGRKLLKNMMEDVYEIR